ncbi:MAG: tellurite resistance TerB family protein [Gammaproteobacteria bacterium]|nr:tellurite resistance TerB family protein [Gammaproteobacteria bacterium]
MAGLADLVGTLMQGGMGAGGQNRLQSALGQGGLGDLFGGSGSGGALGGLMSAAGGLFGQATDSVKGGNPLAVGGLGALAGSLLGGGSGSVKGAVGGGAMALLAGLALKALTGNGAAATAQPPLALRGAQNHEEEQELEQNAELMLRAMVSAAKADGHIDSDELQQILGKLKEAGADAAVQGMVLDLMQAPLDFDALVAAIPNREVAAQVYAASLFAIEVDTDAERDYLARLAAATGLDSAVVAQLHQSLGVS